MHSRIFQIEREPVKKEDYIESSIIPDWFTDGIADYISDGCDRETDIRWLMNVLGTISVRNNDSLTFNSDVRPFFKDRFDSFKEAITTLDNATLDDFISTTKLSYPIYLLEKAFSDKYGYYIYQEDELYTLDEWMRYVTPGETYYFGGTVDYHF